MAGSIQTKEKLEDFINKLALLGFRVELHKKKPQIYSINGERVNIRSRGKSKEIAGGRGFWYNVAFRVLQRVEWVIYLTTDSDHFVMLCSSFLESLKDRMYLDRKNAGVRVFDIDWTEGYLVLKDGRLERVWDSLYDLSDPRFIQNFEIGLDV